MDLATQATDHDKKSGGPLAPTPGIVLVFSRDRPCLVPQPIGPDGTVIGRQDFAGAVTDDDRVSRQHVRVRWSPSGFEVGDAGSRNGTFVNGERATASITVDAGAIVRFGKSIVLLVSDLRMFTPPRPLDEEQAIVGPHLRRAWEEIRRVATASEHLLILGESGSGKELAARVFHASTERAGPCVPVNCAAIPAGVAERLFFGARRGAYSGADKDAEGYLQSASGGTLFLDEIAELDLEVQAKLLRALEAREVLPLGAVRPTKIDIRLCAATHTSLRHLVSTGKFRQDLYYRIGRPEVSLPPLRERREEIPWIIARELGSRRPRVELVEACLLRFWPGNVREILSELRQAVAKATADGRDEVLAEDLDELAGVAIDGEVDPPGPQRPRAAEAPSDQRIREALAAAEGNVTLAARNLGMHRTQLRRWIARHEGGLPDPA